MLNFLGVEPCFIIDGGVLLSSANHKKKDHNFLSYGPNSHQTADV